MEETGTLLEDAVLLMLSLAAVLLRLTAEITLGVVVIFIIGGTMEILGWLLGY